MSLTFESETAPLRYDEQGDIRVGDSRVLLDLVVHAFEGGATPETVVQMYPSLNLPDVYGAIAYYLRHRAKVESYLCQREERAEEVRKSIESRQEDVSKIRERLLRRREIAGTGDVAAAE